MTQQHPSLRPRRTPTGTPSVASRIATLRREIFGHGRRLVAARDPDTGEWSLLVVPRAEG